MRLGAEARREDVEEAVAEMEEEDLESTEEGETDDEDAVRRREPVDFLVVDVETTYRFTSADEVEDDDEVEEDAVEEELVARLRFKDLVDVGETLSLTSSSSSCSPPSSSSMYPSED